MNIKKTNKQTKNASKTHQKTNIIYKLHVNQIRKIPPVNQKKTLSYCF